MPRRFYAHRTAPRCGSIDWASLPPPEPYRFDTYTALHCSAVEMHRLVTQLEYLAQLRPGAYRYVLASILSESTRYMYSNSHCAGWWRAYIRSAFEAAIEAGSIEAIVANSLIECGYMHQELMRKYDRKMYRTKMTSVDRKAAAQKAAATRKRRTEERKVVKAIFADGDAAMADVFDTAARIASMDK